MKKYLVYFKMNWQELFEYRGDIAIWTASGIIVPFVSLLLWLSVSANATLAYSAPEIINYFILVMVVNVLTGAWGSWFISEQINNGSFSRYLLKPISVFTEYLSQNLVEKLFKLAFMAIFLLLLIYGFHFNLKLNIDFFTLVLFLASLAMAIFMSFLFEVLIGLSAFWFHDIDFFKSSISLADGLFSGKVIPVLFLPQGLLTLSSYLPFRYMLSFPVEIILGRLTPSQIFSGFLTQTIWMAATYLTYRVVYEKGIKLHQGYGG